MEQEVPITQRRRQTRSRIYHHIYSSKEVCTKQTIARDLGLSLPTVYQNLTELTEAGLVCYSGELSSTGGRKAQTLDIVTTAGIAVGVSIMENRLRLVAADLRLRELAYRKVPFTPFYDVTRFAPFLAQMVESFLEDNELDRDRVLGVGIAIPGIISTDGSRIAVAPTLGLRDMPLADLYACMPYPVFTENDATCGGHAEWFTRNERQNMAYLSLENGVGGAVLVGGDLVTGDHRHSAEFGHMCIHPGGLPCKCGKQGCLEAYVSARRISDDLGITLDEFFDGMAQGDLQYRDLWEDLLRHLAIGIHNIRMTLDCDIVLGGFLTQYLPPYLTLLKAYVAQCNPLDPDTDYLHLSTLGKNTAPLGAALHFTQEFLNQI